MRVLVVAPTGREYKYMRATLDAAQSTKHNYTLICSGIGKAGAAAGVATAVARSSEPFDAVAVIGFAAGSLDFKQGDVVAPNMALYHDCDVPEGFIPELTDPYNLAGTDSVTVFTGDSFINATSATDIMTRFNCKSAIFDMEIMAVAIAVRDYAGAVPLLAVKFISDVPQSGHNEWSYDEFADSHSDFSPLLSRIESLLDN
ncbi:MAG: hypothetical protein IJ942_05805 [Alistipes sp.]|nr:hypothetical protein [Alistipes sp.]